MISFSPAVKGNWKTDTAPLALILVVALAIRLYALQATTLINPDGALYIQQAHAVSVGNWKAALKSLSFLSNYSLLISLFHPLFPGWLAAARAVSLVFGTLAIVPLYGMLRQFFPRQESLAATAALAFLPTWVINSVDIVRDPVCWFFALYGFYWLTRGLNEQKNYLLPLSCLAFILAAWARIEALVYPASLLLLPLISRRYRDWTLFWFFLPLLLGACVLFISPLDNKEVLLRVSRLGEFIRTVTNGVPQYTQLRTQLLSLLSPEQGNLLFPFLSEARRFVWLIGLGTIVNRLCEAMSYPFTLIALLGVGSFVRLQKNRGLAILFCLFTALALALLYLRSQQTWVIEYRYMMLAILPGSLYFCRGIASLADRTSQHFCISRLTVLVGITALLIISTLPKNLQTRGDSEIDLKEIGQFLNKFHTADREITIATSPKTSRVINFYATHNRPEVGAPVKPGHLYPAVLGPTPSKLVSTLQKKKIDYLVWEENNRPKGWPFSLKDKGLEEIGRWHNPQAGTIIVYRIKKENQ